MNELQKLDREGRKRGLEPKDYLTPSCDATSGNYIVSNFEPTVIKPGEAISNTQGQ